MKNGGYITGQEELLAQDAKALWEAADLLRPLCRLDRPLTLDELREMDGEPVWVKEIVDDMEENWGIITVSERGLFARTVIGSYSKCTYGYYWLAYRRRPEEGKDNETD